MAPKGTSKTTKSETAPAVAAAPAVVAAPAQETATAAPKKRAASKKETETAAAAPAPVVAAPAPTATEVAAPAETSDENLSGTELIIKKMHAQLAETAAQIHAAQNNFKTISTALKALEKEYMKEKKEMQRGRYKH